MNSLRPSAAGATSSRLKVVAFRHASAHSSRSTTQTDRRNVVARKALLRRVLGEFREMPELSPTLAQASRLFGLPPDICLRIFDRLIDKGLLSLRDDGRYRPVSAQQRARQSLGSEASPGAEAGQERARA